MTLNSPFMYLKKFYVNSKAKPETHLITVEIKRALSESQAKNGLILVLVSGGTGGVTLLENDPKIREEFLAWIVAQAPETEGPRPQRRSGSGRLSCHLRAALVGSSLALPVEQGCLGISPWQEVVLFDFEDREGRREFIVQVLSENPGGDK